MIVARQVFQAKYGRGDELVALMRELNERLSKDLGKFPPFRILTDASGNFFTVVTEIEIESFAEWESLFSEAMNQPWLGEWFQKTAEIIDSGHREFYNLVK